MPGSILNNDRKPYLKIIQGKIVQPAKKGDEGAVLREYELPSGEKGSKWEIPFLNWTGVIKSIKFKDSDYGETCNIELDDAFIQLSTSSRYFQDFACKVFNADLTQPLLFHPFDMETEKGKRVTGVSLQQLGSKLKNYFYDYENKVNLHGFPEVDEDKKAKKTYWKIYFAEVAEFLTEKLGELKFPESTTPSPAPEALDEVDVEDLPF